MDKEVLHRSYKQAADALMRLEEVFRFTSAEPTLLRDATIQRFEFSYELMWKLFRKVHIVRGVPRENVRRAFECIAEAGAAGWLKDRALWEQMIQDRNYTSHEYDESAADGVADRTKTMYLPEMKRTLSYIKEHFIDREPLDGWKDRAEKK